MSDDALEINAKYYSFNRLVYYHHLRSSLSLKKNRVRLRFKTFQRLSRPFGQRI